MSEIVKIKRALRQEIKARRSRLGSDSLRDKSERIVDQVLAWPGYHQAETILAFSPMAEEVQIQPLFDRIRADGKKLAFPVCLKPRVMSAYLPRDWRQMSPDRFGILSPDPARDQLLDPACLDLVLVPLVAFDRKKRRLGYGGGYYDNFLPLVTDSCPKLGIAFACQEVDEIPVEDHDQVLDFLLTEESFV